MQDANINVTGLKEIQKTLKNIEDKTTNTKPLMLELANHLHNIVLDSFESQSSPDRKKWSPIKSGKKRYCINQVTCKILAYISKHQIVVLKQDLILYQMIFNTHSLTNLVQIKQEEIEI